MATLNKIMKLVGILPFFIPFSDAPLYFWPQIILNLINLYIHSQLITEMWISNAPRGICIYM